MTVFGVFFVHYASQFLAVLRANFGDFFASFDGFWCDFWRFFATFGGF